MLTYKIEKGIPVKKKGTNAIYPFREMEVGDSCIIGEYSRKLMSKYSNATRNWKNKCGHPSWCCAVRKEGENIRVWRTN